LRAFPALEDPNVIVGATAGDDAGVYRISEDRALVFTTDFFTPIVDDPYDFGRIAAANALSDVYAMGGTPFVALNLVCFPKDDLPMEVLIDILRGGADKAREAGVVIIGGHTIDDPEPKYGMAVTGYVDPRRVVTNAAAKPGDELFLTKPLGTGIVGTAIKRSAAEPAHVAAAVDSMSTLNRSACEAMLEVGVNACTDITGFGLLGHLLNMADASDATIRIDFDRLPLLPGTMAYAQAGVVPGGTERNLEAVEGQIEWPAGFAEDKKLILADAQTSGGLAISVPAERASDLEEALRRHGVSHAVRIGRVLPRGAMPLLVAG